MPAITLCETCHDYIHEIEKNEKRRVPLKEIVR